MDSGGKGQVPPPALLPLLTKQYQHGVLQLCQESNSRESWAAAQYLLEKCWIETAAPQNSESEGTIYLCPQCGAWLHPGWQGSTLRVARFPNHSAIHRTRKRRIQRKKRRALLLQKMKAKEFKTSKQTIGLDAKSGESQVEQVLLRTDSDLFMDRHHLVIRCGRCDAKIRIKGLKRESPPTKQMIQQVQVDKSGARVQRHDKRPTSSAPLASSNQIPDSLVDGDFLQLPPGPSKATIMNPSITLSKHPPVHLRNPKKEKKKAKGSSGKDSKLLNFLSSLND
mmetsp:Transcript_63656/g.184635  ORF Transcript_63656/g.184635 Transcript_63656/m.184635 type:complete len:281 (+) Transcript_63656:121-963(+)